MIGSYRSALSARDRTVLASERSNIIVLPTITSRTTVMTAKLTTSWALSASSLWRKLSTLKCATVHTSHKVTHVALPNPDRSNRVAVAKRFSQVRFRPCKLNYFHQCGVPALSSGEGKSPFVCPDPSFSAALDPMIALDCAGQGMTGIAELKKARFGTAGTLEKLEHRRFRGQW